MEVSLIIPCFNEEGNIENLVKKCEKFLSNKNNELVLVNNGSSDNTEKKIDAYSNISNLKKINVDKNQGFGYGVLQGLINSSGKILSYTHADDQTDPNDILKGLEFLEDKQNNNFFIKGYRVDKIKNNWKLLNLIVSYAMTIFESILFQKILYDIHAQPSIFHRNFLDKWKKPPKDFGFDLYVYYLAKKFKLKVIRFPVKFDVKGRLSGEGSNDTVIKTIVGCWEHIISSIILRFRI